MPELVKYTKQEALDYHQDNWGGQGKIEVTSRVPAGSVKDLTLAYTPGVAEVCRAISKDISRVHDYTGKDNLVAVVTDGTAVLGLGDIGPEAGLPVMEGKAVLFKVLAGVDAFPVCLKTTEPQKIVEMVCAMEPSFGGINLEDISAPRCFEIEEQLTDTLNIPVFHDDQHGTAVVVLSALVNALKVVDKKIAGIKVVVNGAGASGIAVTRLIMSAGVKNAILCDSKGAIYQGRPQGMNPVKEQIARITNTEGIKGSLADAIKGADVFLGLSIGNQVDQDMVRSMNSDAIVFAMANPDPEIQPDAASAAGARIVASGRSDYRNQINNVLGFPGIFRGALDVRASVVNEEMKIAAAYAIASQAEDKLSEEYIIVNPLHEDVIAREAQAVARAALDTKVAQLQTDPDEVYARTRKLTTFCRERFPLQDGLFKRLS